ncbi:unnamed protein product [Acanthosepion pharaonis]|uniref:Uncharacterized protein n=1 Tax=Acanthosepion pharaonis TaxID=158019 RepID=A0A812B094_ACAPH|nr:unnamed protein product [Sepia pharaonis]
MCSVECLRLHPGLPILFFFTGFDVLFTSAFLCQKNNPTDIKDDVLFKEQEKRDQRHFGCFCLSLREEYESEKEDKDTGKRSLSCQLPTCPLSSGLYIIPYLISISLSLSLSLSLSIYLSISLSISISLSLSLHTILYLSFSVCLSLSPSLSLPLSLSLSVYVSLSLLSSPSKIDFFCCSLLLTFPVFKSRFHHRYSKRFIVPFS